jgi:hypothetical protein
MARLRKFGWQWKQYHFPKVRVWQAFTRRWRNSESLEYFRPYLVTEWTLAGNFYGFSGQ